MNRIFHTRITWYQYLYLIVLGLVAFFLLWQKVIILAAISMLLLVFFIERLIHTTYTITTDNTLELYAGRFSKKQTIDISGILSVEKKHSFRVGRLTGVRFVLIHYGADKYVSVFPVKEREFLELMDQRMNLK